MKAPLLLFFLGFIASSYAQDLELELFASNLESPVNIKHAGNDKLYVVERDGFIKIINADGTIESTLFLDIDSKVINTGSERGLLGLAFHPDYASNGYFFVNYINNSGNTVISRFSRNTINPLLADPDSELIILSYDQPYTNHNGGDLAFGADGYLYISSGDGGSGGDPDNYGQNTLSLLGKILRLDIDSSTSTENYTIPSTNPFVGNTNFRAEIWAYGLRNPWKFSFDRLNGDLWIADVGQNNFEEINRVSAAEAAAGINYGWRCYEANAPYNTNGCGDASTYTFPIDGYSHTDDGLFKCSITGGYRYRGLEYSGFEGWYFFADYCSQEIGYLVYDDTTDTWTKTLNLFSGNWSAFGEAYNGELYISDLSSGNIYKITDTTLSIGEDLKANISIYPNPSETVVNINFGTTSKENIDVTISIYDIQGHLVKSIQRNNHIIQQINTSDLSTGIYILKIGSKTGAQTSHKLVIN